MTNECRNLIESIGYQSVESSEEHFFNKEKRLNLLVVESGYIILRMFFPIDYLLRDNKYILDAIHSRNEKIELMSWHYYPPTKKNTGLLWCQVFCKLNDLIPNIKSLEDEWEIFKPSVVGKVYFANATGSYLLAGNLFAMRKTKKVAKIILIIIVLIILFLIYKCI